MEKKRMGKKGQLLESPLPQVAQPQEVSHPQQPSNILLLSLLVFVGISLMLSFVNPLLVIFSNQGIILVSQIAGAFALLSLLSVLFALIKKQKRIIFLCESLSIILFNTAFIYPGALLTLSASLLLCLVSILFALRSIKKQEEKQINILALVAALLLFLLQVTVGILILTGVLSAA